MYFPVQLYRSVSSFIFETVILAYGFLGMAKAVADINNPDEKQGGFASDNSDITGFSHMHDSGTGGVSSTCLYAMVDFLIQIQVTISWKFSVVSTDGLPRGYIE